MITNKKHPAHSRVFFVIFGWYTTLMMKAMYVFLALALFTGSLSFVYQFYNREAPEIALPEEVLCTMDALACPDGSFVGRTGPKCEFVCPPGVELDPIIAASIAAHADIITLDSPAPQGVITNPLTLKGTARGPWFFEASFPVMLTNWDGLIIAQGPATAVGDWMTTEFVPFTMNLAFSNPYQTGDPDFMKRGTLILKKDNPSGLPENDDALEIPIRFAP